MLVKKKKNNNEKNEISFEKYFIFHFQCWFSLQKEKPVLIYYS